MKRIVIAILCAVLCGACSRSTIEPKPLDSAAPLSRQGLINAARTHALQSEQCKAFLDDISSRFSVDTDRPLSQVEVHEPTRTVRFIHNLIPQDGPMFVISVQMKDDGSLLKLDTRTDSPNTIPAVIPANRK